MSADLQILPARSRGRPSLYDCAYCERVLELAAEGCGKAEIAAALSVSRKTLNAWIKAHGEFREAVRQAKDLEYAWWLATGRKGQFEKGWNAASWALQMRNRFGGYFADRSDKPAKRKRKGSKNAERLRAEMERKLSRIADAGEEEAISLLPDPGRTGDIEL